MKAKFPKIVERGRVVRGEWASDLGDTFGWFILSHPVSGLKLKVMVGDGRGWDHVSVSPVSGRRVPSWEAMCWVKSLFFDAEECVVQYHPPASKYVNDYPYVLHLWRPQTEDFPQPPIICV